jgi:signal transduction histidine kinase
MMPGPAIDILVVEDAEPHAELIARVFEPAGDRFRLRVATDLASARAAIDERVPHLVIADNRLPDGRGLELVVPGGDYPLVLMTSHGDEAAAVEAMKAGALDYVTKKVEVLLDMPHIAERALREWGHILERRRAEAELQARELELRHAQKLEAIGRLASGVAHDFNNVLMGIAGCVEVAASKLDDAHPARTYLDEVRSAARRASSITARLLAFGRRGELAREVLAVDALIRAVATIARPLLPADIDLVLDLRAPRARVDGDAGQLEQVVLNLATNARDAMPGGGRLSVTTRDDGDGHVEIVVADTGSGMDEATRARVFEPFFTTKEVGRGTGLGLATVYGIVHQHGGEIELDSALGVGTTFRIRLACVAAPPDEEPVAVAIDARAAPEPCRVLVVEDDPLVRATTRHYLTRGGHDVTEARDVDEALARFRIDADRLDVIVTDVVLPGGGGARVADVARAARPGLAVLFMSAHPADVLQAERRIPPGTAVLQKPFTEDALLAAVQRLARPSLLLVEDDPGSRLAAAALLSDAGFEVHAAASATQALALFRQHRIDAVVTDLGLPDGDGGDLARRLRANEPSLPIVIMTGRAASDPAVRAALTAPRTAVAVKPVDIDVLVATIRGLLPRKAAG